MSASMTERDCESEREQGSGSVMSVPKVREVGAATRVWPTVPAAMTANNVTTLPSGRQKKKSVTFRLH